jgi:DNA-binding response OmpR family regulator
MVDDGLSGRRILVVEDEFYIADEISRILRQSGADVVGPFATLGEAEQAIGTGQFDCAILDMNLRGEMSFSLADRLEAAGIPYLIATGYNSGSLPERFSGQPRIEKPFEPGELAAVLPGLLA